MTVIEFLGITKSYGDREILNIENLKINEKEKIGIVGQNGTGKTTFLDLVAGEILPDSGKLKVSQEISYIRQFEELPEEEQFLSGGEKTKKKLQEKMKWNIPILLADEPSTHLDMKRVDELQGRLQKFDGTVLLISHDRELLDGVCTSILEIEDSKVRKYIGNYSDYQEQKNQEKMTKQKEYEQYREEKARLEKSKNQAKQNAKGMKKTPNRMGNSEARLHKREIEGKREKIERHSKSLEVRLSQLEVKEKPKSLPILSMKFETDFSKVKSKYAVTAESITISRGNRVLIQDSSFYIPTNKKVAIIGENGVGKTTLLNSIFKQEEGIRLNNQMECGYFSQELEGLKKEKTILENVLKESIQTEEVVRNVLGRLLFRDKEVAKNVGVLSGGEKVKVAIAKLLVSNHNMLLLDEPTNFLDLYSLEALEKLLLDYPGTVLFATHDRRFLEKIANQLLIIENQKITVWEGTYQQYLKSK